ncbi:hypothetical protein HYI06_10465 [Clostridium botulinum]|nr:hypothetical protein [Clostridium botulinum]MBY7004536.1 hypothetical protein [Clostridium botulinum]MCC5416471.1 hypothetical protein [Clostridium botulinum]MCR1147201.1 hypothetical protein [Clostridium botulinum]
MKIEPGYINFGNQIDIFNLIKYMNKEKEINKSLKKNQDKEVKIEK